MRHLCKGWLLGHRLKVRAVPSLVRLSVARASPHRRSACLLSQPFPHKVRFSLKSDYLFGTKRILTAVPAKQTQMRHTAVHWNRGFAAAVLPQTWKGFSCKLTNHNTGQRARPAAPRLPGGWKRWNYSAYPWKRAGEGKGPFCSLPEHRARQPCLLPRAPGGAISWGLHHFFFSELQLNSYS